MTRAGRFNAILLMAIFLPYVFGFAVGANIQASGLLSVDKVVRLAVLYFAMLALLMSLRRSSIPANLGLYFWSSVVILLSLSYHYLAFDGADIYSFVLKKEFYRVAAFIMIFMLCAIGGLERDDYRLLIAMLAAMGALVGLFSIWHSVTGETQASWRYVADFLRAGTEITDANTLGAFLNIASMLAIAGFLLSNWRWKTGYFVALLLIQAGRFFTFSTGSFYSIALSVLAVIFLLGKYDRLQLRRFLLLLISIVAIFTVAIWATGTFDTLFYRIKFSDEYIWRESIFSRLTQYEDFMKFASESPERLLYGFGGSWLQRSSAGMEFHNSYLKPLVSGGIPAFVGFNLMWLLALRNFILVMRNGAGEILVLSSAMLAAFLGWSLQSATIPADTSIIQWFFFIIGYALMRSAAIDVNTRAADYAIAAQGGCT